MPFAILLSIVCFLFFSLEAISGSENEHDEKVLVIKTAIKKRILVTLILVSFLVCVCNKGMILFTNKEVIPRLNELYLYFPYHVTNRVNHMIYVFQ